jgi:hypothetical protein
MATITATQVIGRVSTILQDPTNIRWPTAELLKWLNDGQREICMYKPNAYTKNIVVQLTAGTKQTLPTDANVLITVMRNMGTSGTAAGNAIRLTSREILDSQLPDWHASTASATVKHYIYNMLDPKTFYVYPPQPASGASQVELAYGASPADIAEGATLLVDDVYMSTLINYMLFRAYSKDNEYSGNAKLAGEYYQAFTGMLAGKASTEGSTNPNSTAAGNRNIA